MAKERPYIPTGYFLLSIEKSGWDYLPWKEQIPYFDDMLRYDTAFVHLDRPNEVLFPVWPGERMPRITYKRWESFDVTLGPGSRISIPDPQGWFTHAHRIKPGGYEDKTVYLSDILAGKERPW